MVPRDEFDAIKAVAVKAREAQEGLEARVAALEAEIATLQKLAPRSARKKAAPKTSD
jgi:BMFP domain-containing protein YqiC